jgi:mono/diheme cytochrome c family protein
MAPVTIKRRPMHRTEEKHQQGATTLTHALFAAVLLGLVFAATPTTAQEDQSPAGLQVWRLSGCASCHGTFGQGGGGGEQPEGPSLRRTILDRDAIKETISCGRPGSKMPFFLKGAYTATRCWGIEMQEEPPAEMIGLGSLTPARIDALVDYLMTRVVGKNDEVTKQECISYFGNPNHPTCNAMK